MEREDRGYLPERSFPSLAAAKQALLNHKSKLQTLRQKINAYTKRSNVSAKEAWRRAWVTIADRCAKAGIYWQDKRTIRVNINGDIKLYTIDQLINFLS